MILNSIMCIINLLSHIFGGFSVISFFFLFGVRLLLVNRLEDSVNNIILLIVFISIVNCIYIK